MRMGLLTMPLNINYDGILQAYTFQTMQERMRHDVTRIVRYPHLQKYQ